MSLDNLKLLIVTAIVTIHLSISIHKTEAIDYDGTDDQLVPSSQGYDGDITGEIQIDPAYYIQSQPSEEPQNENPVSPTLGEVVEESDSTTEDAAKDDELSESVGMENKIFKESPPEPLIQTTLVPDYIQNHKAANDDVQPIIASDDFETNSSAETNSNETLTLAMKTNVLYTEDDNVLQARAFHADPQLLDTHNASAEEEYVEDQVAEDLEQIAISELIGTTTAAPTPMTSATTTPLLPTPPPRTKQGKQIHIKRLLPHEQLRNYIEDAYIRMPLAVIVDPSPYALEKTKSLWRDALRTNVAIKIVLVALSTSGLPTAYNFNNTRQFLAGLNSIKENTGGNAFAGVIQASELVPYDSAVFISTSSIPAHTDLVQDAAITLLKKRIRLYLIWYGEKAISENETQEATGGILGDVAIRSGGEILHVVGNENSQEIEGNTLTLVADAFHGSQDIEIPVDTTLSSLHIKIDAPVRSATLETPNGG